MPVQLHILTLGVTLQDPYLISGNEDISLFLSFQSVSISFFSPFSPSLTSLIFVYTDRQGREEDLMR